MITIYDRNGAVLLQVEVDSTSYVFKQLMGDNSLVLNYSLPEHVELPVGSYCIFQGETYTVVSPEAVKKQHSRYYEYTVTFESAQSKAKFRKFRNSVDGRLTFSLTARPKEHLQMFVDNMNRHDSGWEVDEANCIDATEKVISYDHSSCLEALKMMADAFETEWEIVGKRVVLKKVEYNRSEPLALSYGRGNGFKPGLGRSNFSDSPAVEILLPQGGERNIIRSEYGSPTLLLPLGQTLAYDGEYFEDEAGFNPATARTYITEADGRSLQRVGRTFDTYAEESLDCTEFYPKRVGVVTAVEVNSDGIYTFTDDTVPDGLNYLDHIIGGETMTVIFQSGQLAGREFEVRYKHSHEVADGNGGRETVYDKCFSIVPADIDGVEMPGGSFVPQTAGGDREADTYVVFNCSLPEEYICHNPTKSGASWDMFRAAVRYLYDHEDQRFSFTGELDGLWAKGDWENIGGKIKLGGYISFTDAHFQSEPVLVRIIGIRQYVNNPHSPKLELSNATVSGGFSTELKRIESTEVKVEDRHKEAMNYAKRRFKDAQETMEMLSAAFSGDYTNPIRPSTIQSLMALIGDERLQFTFCSMPTSSNPTGTQRDVNITHDATTDTVTVSVPNGTVLHHLTLGNHTLTASSGAGDAKYYWTISTFLSGDLDAEKAYYIYAKCSKGTTLNSSLGINVGSGSFYISDRSVDMDGREEDTDFYYFLVAVLGSRDTMGERSHSKVYGFTEILPGRITTDVIKSADGTNVIDLLLGRFLLGDGQSGLSWNESGNGKLVIKGAIQVDGGGNEGPTIVQRGAFSASARYYWGNVVTYNGASYMCLDDSVGGISGIYPTNTSKWRVFAERGHDGNDGHSPYIGTNGNWFFWSSSSNSYVDSGLSAEGDDGHSPYIGSNGNWYEWDAVNNQYHDTGIKAKGKDGEPGTPGQPGTDGKWTKFQYCVSSYEYALNSIPENAWSWTYPTTSLAGKYAYVRQMESSDSGQTWAEIPNTRGWWHDPSAEADVAGRDQTATFLGYPDWESFMNATKAADVIIRGGYLNAALIETKALVADAIFTALAGQRLILSGSSMVVNDNTNNQVMAFSGDKSYTSFSNFVSQSGSTKSASFSINANSNSFQLSLTEGEHGALDFDREALTTSGSVTLSSPYSYSFNAQMLPSSQITMGAGVTRSEYHFDIQLFFTDGTTNYPAGRVFESSAIDGFSTRASGTLPPGTYTLMAVVDGFIGGSLDNWHNNGTLTVKFSMSSTSVTFVPVTQGTEVFLNGMGYRFNANNYMAAVNLSSGLEWGVRSGNYGLTVDPYGIKAMLDGSSWKSPFIVEIAASLTCSSSVVTINSQTSQTGNRITAAQRTGTGAYTITLSSSIGNYACVMATPRNTSTSSTSLMWVQSQSGTSVKIYNRTSSSGGSNASDPSGFNLLIIKTS